LKVLVRESEIFIYIIIHTHELTVKGSVTRLPPHCLVIIPS